VKTIRNKTPKPLKVPLLAGKTLYLGPLKEGQIADSAADTPALRRLLVAGAIEIVGEGAAHQQAAARAEEGPRPGGQAHRPETRMGHKGER
jgi:hypothetical protein